MSMANRVLMALVLMLAACGGADGADLAERTPDGGRSGSGSGGDDSAAAGTAGRATGGLAGRDEQPTAGRGQAGETSEAGEGGAGGEGGDGSDVGGASGGQAGGRAGAGGKASGGGGAGGGAGKGAEDCECSEGPCCDGCHVRPAGYECGESAIGFACEATGVATDYWARLCDGVSVACETNGWFKSTAVAPCAERSPCLVTGAGSAECAPCECSEGECCDGCRARPASHLCSEEIVSAQCNTAKVAQNTVRAMYCDGSSTGACMRSVDRVETEMCSDIHHAPCRVSAATGAAACTPCTCSQGACCDGCIPRPKGFSCNVTTAIICESATMSALGEVETFCDGILTESCPLISRVTPPGGGTRPEPCPSGCFEPSDYGISPHAQCVP